MNDLWAVNVLIGDRYSNPAATSAVYFRSTAGVVEGTNGSAATSKDGQVTVNLITGHPFADEAVARIPGMDPGFAWIHAQTVGERGAIVQDSTLVLCTGLGTISNVSPAFLDVPDSGSAVVSFKVSDLYNHPLASGTTISVVATLPPPSYPDAPQNKVLVSFGTEGTITLGDMMVGGTDFTARVSDGSWEIHQGTPFYLSITVKGPNTNNLPITQEIDGMVH